MTAEEIEARARASAEKFSSLSRLLLTEETPLRWTGQLVPLLGEDGRLCAVKTAFSGGGRTRWALDRTEESAGARERQDHYCAQSGLDWVIVPEAEGDASDAETSDPGDGAGAWDAAAPEAGADARRSTAAAPELMRAGAWIRKSAEYRAVAEFYGDRTTQRSGVRLIEHVHEGIAVLRSLGASEAALGGYCLHPLVQGDDELRESLARGRLRGLDPEAVALALEYRSVANGFLSPMEDHPGYEDPRAIRRSPLAEVDAMLIADKIQNAKDFGLYHRRSHPQAAWLARYFDRWLSALEVSAAQARSLTLLITAPTVRVVEPESLL